MGETNSPSVAHVGYDISQLSRVKLKNLTLLSGEISQLTWATEGESIIFSLHKRIFW